MTTAVSPPALPARLNGSAAVTPARRRTGKKVGRRSKFTVKLRTRLVELIGRGLPYGHACSAVGISFASFSSYRNLHPDFADQIEQAVGDAIENRLAIIERAANLGDTGCARWLLEHLHPQHFARSRLEISGLDGSPLAGAVAVYLPKKDDVNGKPVVTVDTITKELGNER
jgi:hypothetical protein